MSTAYPVEAQMIGGTAPNVEAYTYINSSGVGMSITNHEIIGIPGDPGQRIAAVLMTGEKSATIGTLANGETGTVYIAGRVKVPKSTSTAFLQGAPVYWDTSVNQADDITTANTTSDFCLGAVSDAAAASATHVVLDLNKGPSAYSLASSSSSSSSSSSISST